MSKRVISYSLYGSNPFYCEGAIKNAKDKSSTYGDSWESWFYVYEDVPQNYLDELKKYADRVIPITSDFPVQNGTIWRFLAIDDPEVDIMLIRDIDSRPTQKEKKLVDEWLASDKQYHIIRDGSTHQMPFLACSFGIRKGNGLSIIELLLKHPQYMKKSNVYIIDQLFLAHCIYPLTVNNRLVHDSFNHYELDGFHRLERTERFIGERMLEDGTPEDRIVLNNMNNRFIYFHRNIDLYNTEQFGAFLYEFMENLQIARKMGRTLVIPNVFIAPRNNDKILKEKHIYLKSLSLVPITNFLDLSEIDTRYVKLLPLAEFYEKTYNNPAIVMYNPTRVDIDDYIVKNKLLTQFGKMSFSKIIQINTYALNTLQILTSDSFKQLDNIQNLIIVDNGRLCQPNWHPERIKLDYFWIRMSLMFKRKYQTIADNFVLDNNIRTTPTLLLHWRSGDRILGGKTHKNKYEKMDDETNQYWHNYNLSNNIFNIIANILEIKRQNLEIKQLFLVTNHSNREDIEFIKNELLKFNINLIEYNSENDNQQKEGMIQQLIGAQCKYHLHGPTQYERMSAFGRWIIEERKRYYFNEQYITTMEVFNHVYFVKNMI